jgi:hypothetical protein
MIQQMLSANEVGIGSSTSDGGNNPIGHNANTVASVIYP